MFKITNLLALLAYCSLTSRVFASHCYSDICHNKSAQLESSGPQCLLTSIQRGKDCVNLRFENLGLATLIGESLGKFRLSAYVKDFGEFHGRTTAFNLSISDVKFYRLITRYQDSSHDRNAACREIEIYGNSNETLFPEIFVSCPFAEETFEGIPYRLEYLAVGESFEYSRKLVFFVPRHAVIDEDTNDVTTYTPFFYVDVSNMAILSLHIQPAPRKFNVTRYKVWLVNNDTNSALSMELEYNEEREIQHNFSVVEGVHYFKVAAVHPLCGDNGCVNGTSPAISTKQPVRRLLIMIISVVWMPPVLLYAMYYAYKLCMKNSLEKRHDRRINCLLVYSPTHLAHIDVMQKLANYMRSCNINAMIDILDITETTNQDPGLWCNSAFRDADVIIVATSPPPGNSIVPVIYQNMDNHALRLLKDNYPRGNKRYYVVQFPYCKRDDLPEEARLFRRFVMPQELEKLVRNIYAVDRVRFFGVSRKEFAQSVKLAMSEITRERTKKVKSHDETGPTSEAIISDVLLTSEINPEKSKIENDQIEKIEEKHNDEEKSRYFTTKIEEKHNEDEKKQYFTTKIDELNLLGDSGESETFIYKPVTNDKEFRIDLLDL